MRNIIIESKGVEKLLSNLKTSKAVGPDIIPNIVLKTCASELSVGLGSIFQYSLDTGTLPMDWRDANISPVFKKGDRHQAENYRPVSLTSISCKLLEHILCSHILKHFEQYYAEAPSLVFFKRELLSQSIKAVWPGRASTLL